MNLIGVKPDVHGVELTAVDFSTDLTPFDGLLHKFTYQLVDGNEAQVARVAEFAATHPGFAVVEPIEHMSVFTSRQMLGERMRDVQLPPYTEYVDGVELTEGVSLPFPFPVMVKRIIGCGTPESHIIEIVHNEEQLRSIDVKSDNFIVFPFVRHYGTVFKGYALGDKSFIYPTPSIVLSDDKMISFDSQKAFPEEIMNKNFSEAAAMEICPTEEEVSEMAKGIAKGMSVGIFGFDVLRREEDRKLIIVDVNYFPCFRRMEDFAGKIAEFLKQRVALEKRE